MNENILVLKSSELDQIQELVKLLLKYYDDFDSVEFLKNLPTVAYKLPERLVRFLNEFKYDPPNQGYCVISNFHVDEESLGVTPSHWQLESNNDNCKDLVMTMCLCSTILGDIFGWLTQQNGRMVHDVLPIKYHQQEQLGSGSEQELWWHTEDAFHELRGDYLMLMCLRNHDAIPTTLARPNFSKLKREQIDILFEKKFTIRPDNSHSKAYGAKSCSSIRERIEHYNLDKAYQEMSMREQKPEKVAVLFGNKSDPYLRIDPYFMDEPKTAEERDALKAIIDLIEESIVELPLNRGDCVVVDNYMAVHGRRAFKARYDGNDRWLKRINIVRDIRRCHQVLDSKSARIIY